MHNPDCEPCATCYQSQADQDQCHDCWHHIGQDCSRLKSGDAESAECRRKCVVAYGEEAVNCFIDSDCDEEGDCEGSSLIAKHGARAKGKAKGKSERAARQAAP